MWTWRPSMRLSSTVMPLNSAMFWKVRATPSSATRLGENSVIAVPSSAMPPRSAAESAASRTPRSREPPLAPLVVLHVPVALALAHAREPKVELLDVLVLADRLSVAVQHHTSLLPNITL